VLSPRSKKPYLELAQNDERFGANVSVEQNIFATNAIPHHRSNVAYSAVFPTVYRLNHSCNANATYKWHNELGRMAVHAIKPNRKGAEITVNYGFDGQAVTRELRQRRLRDSFGFQCLCSKCGAPR